MTIEYTQVGDKVTRKETKPVEITEYDIIPAAKLEMIDSEILELQAKIDALNAEKELLNNPTVIIQEIK